MVTSTTVSKYFDSLTFSCEVFMKGVFIACAFAEFSNILKEDFRSVLFCGAYSVSEHSLRECSDEISPSLISSSITSICFLFSC